MDKAVANEIWLDRESDLLGIADEHEDLLHGRCHLFAIALSKVSGYPVGAFLEEGFSASGRRCHCLVHAFVNVDGLYVDIRGAFKSAKSFLAEMPMDGEVWESKISTGKLLKLGEGSAKRTPEISAELAKLQPLAAEVWTLSQEMIEAMKYAD